jgi:hypothetical protein
VSTYYSILDTNIKKSLAVCSARGTYGWWGLVGKKTWNMMIKMCVVLLRQSIQLIPRLKGIYNVLWNICFYSNLRNLQYICV